MYYFAICSDGMGGWTRCRLRDEAHSIEMRREGWPVYGIDAENGDYDHRTRMGKALTRYRMDVAQGRVRYPQL